MLSIHLKPNWGTLKQEAVWSAADQYRWVCNWSEKCSFYFNTPWSAAAAHFSEVQRRHGSSRTAHDTNCKQQLLSYASTLFYITVNLDKVRFVETCVGSEYFCISPSLDINIYQNQYQYHDFKYITVILKKCLHEYYKYSKPRNHISYRMLSDNSVVI